MITFSYPAESHNFLNCPCVCRVDATHFLFSNFCNYRAAVIITKNFETKFELIRGRLISAAAGA